MFRYFTRFFFQVKPIEFHLPTHNAMLLTLQVNDKIPIHPGQYVLIQCENISTLEWHPFYIIDFFIQPRQTVFTLAIGVRGDWTRELYEKVFDLKIHAKKMKRRRHKSSGRRTQLKKLTFVMDGPFPNQAEAMLASERIVMIAFGIGVAPFISIFNYLM